MNQNAMLMTIDTLLTPIEAPNHEAAHSLHCCLFCDEANATHGEYCASCWERYADEYLTWYEEQARLNLIALLTLQALRAWAETTPRAYAGYPCDGVACPLAFYLNDLTGAHYEWCVDIEAVTDQREMWPLSTREPRSTYHEFASYALPDWACELIRRVDAFDFGCPLTKAQFLTVLDELEARYPTAA